MGSVLLKVLHTFKLLYVLIEKTKKGSLFSDEQQRSIFSSSLEVQFCASNSVRPCCAVKLFLFNPTFKMSNRAIVVLVNAYCKKRLLNKKLFFVLLNMYKGKFKSLQIMYKKYEKMKRLNLQHAPHVNLCYVNCAMLLKNVY